MKTAYYDYGKGNIQVPGMEVSMRIVVLNGSPHQKGNTKKMIDAFAEGAESTGHQVDVLDVCQKQIGGCMACEYCHIKGKGVCIQKDDMQEVYGLLKQADMLVLALLFIVHHVLNFGWAKNLFKGKYTSSRIFCTVLLGLLFVDIIVLVVSGIMMSGYVFPMISIHSGIVSARRLHMITAYWGLILLSAHLGYNWVMITGMAGKVFHVKLGGKKRRILFRLISVLVSAYGIYALYVHRVYEYLVLKNIFMFWDYERPAWQVIFDYTAMMYLFAAIAYYIKIFLGCKAPQSRDFPVDYMRRKK